MNDTYDLDFGVLILMEGNGCCSPCFVPALEFAGNGGGDGEGGANGNGGGYGGVPDIRSILGNGRSTTLSSGLLDTPFNTPLDLFALWLITSDLTK